MSKESAMALATGQAPATPAPGATNDNPTNSQAPAQPAAATTDPRVQALLKKETSLVNEREAFSREKSKHAEELKKANEILAKGKQFDELMAKNDAMSALKLIGFSDTQIFNIMSEAGKEPTPKSPEEIARETTEKLLKEQREADQKAQAEATTKANDMAVTTSIRQLLNNEANAEKFEYCVFHGELAQDTIRETLFQVAAQEKADAEARGETYVIDEPAAQKLLQEAAEMVEKYYEDMDKQMNEKIKKRKKLFGETTQEATAAVEAEVQAQAQEPAAPAKPATPARPPVTNKMAPTAAATASQRETAQQKRARLERVLATGDRTLLRS